jgi:hypothetical protein
MLIPDAYQNINQSSSSNYFIRLINYLSEGLKICRILLPDSSYSPEIFCTLQSQTFPQFITIYNKERKRFRASIKFFFLLSRTYVTIRIYLTENELFTKERKENFIWWHKLGSLWIFFLTWERRHCFRKETKSQVRTTFILLINEECWKVLTSV